MNILIVRSNIFYSFVPPNKPFTMLTRAIENTHVYSLFGNGIVFNQYDLWNDFYFLSSFKIPLSFYWYWKRTQIKLIKIVNDNISNNVLLVEKSDITTKNPIFSESKALYKMVVATGKTGGNHFLLFYILSLWNSMVITDKKSKKKKKKNPDSRTVKL